jgi:hypothetical protein
MRAVGTLCATVSPAHKNMSAYVRATGCLRLRGARKSSLCLRARQQLCRAEVSPGMEDELRPLRAYAAYRGDRNAVTCRVVSQRQKTGLRRRNGRARPQWRAQLNCYYCSWRYSRAPGVLRWAIATSRTCPELLQNQRTPLLFSTGAIRMVCRRSVYFFPPPETIRRVIRGGSRKDP